MVVSLLQWHLLCHHSLLCLSRGQAGNSWHRHETHRFAFRISSGHSLYLHQQAFIPVAFGKYTLFTLNNFSEEPIFCGVTSALLNNCSKLIKPRFHFRAKSFRFGKSTKGQLNVVHCLEFLPTFLPSNPDLLDSDCYFWQASLLPFVGRADHRLDLNISAGQP